MSVGSRSLALTRLGTSMFFSQQVFLERASRKGSRTLESAWQIILGDNFSVKQTYAGLFLANPLEGK